MDRTALLIGQLDPGQLVHRQHASCHGAPEVVDGPLFPTGQGGIRFGIDLASAWTVGGQGLDADELHDLPCDAIRHGPLRAHIEDELALLLVGDVHLAGAEVFEHAGAVNEIAAVGQPHAKLEERISLPFRSKTHDDLLDDDRTAEVDLQDPVVDRSRLIGFPIRGQVTIDSECGRFGAGAGVAHAAVDCVLIAVVEEEPLGVQCHIRSLSQQSWRHRTILINYGRPLRCLPRRPLLGAFDDDLAAGDAVARIDGLLRSLSTDGHGEKRECNGGAQASQYATLTMP